MLHTTCCETPHERFLTIGKQHTARSDADYIETGLQAFADPMEKAEYRTVSSTVRDAVARNGVLSLWSGFAPRAFRVVGAAFILNGCRTKLEESVLAYKAKDTKTA